MGWGSVRDYTDPVGAHTYKRIGEFKDSLHHRRELLPKAAVLIGLQVHLPGDTLLLMILLHQYAERPPRQSVSKLAQAGTLTASQGGPTELGDRDYSAIMGTQTATLVRQEASDSDDRFKHQQSIIPR